MNPNSEDKKREGKNFQEEEDLNAAERRGEGRGGPERIGEGEEKEELRRPRIANAKKKMNSQNRVSSLNPMFTGRSSSSCTPLKAKNCGCGKEAILYKSNSEKNPGKLFWRCPNWREKGTCGLFEWDRGSVEDGSEESSNKLEGVKMREDLNSMMDKKIGNLRRDMDEIMQRLFAKLSEDMDDMKEKKITKLKMKLKKERLKINMMWIFLVLSWGVALAKHF